MVLGFPLLSYEKISRFIDVLVPRDRPKSTVACTVHLTVFDFNCHIVSISQYTYVNPPVSIYRERREDTCIVHTFKNISRESIGYSTK